MPEAAQQIYSIYKALKNRAKEAEWREKAASLMFKRGVNFLKSEGRLGYIDKAIHINPKSLYLQTRAQAYLEKKQPLFALQDFNVLYHRTPKNQQVLFGLAQAFQQLGLKDAARTYAQKILDKNPSHTSALKLMQQLSK